MKSAPIVLAAGGTGGHFFPAEALAAVLKERGYSLILMTDARNTRAGDGPFHDCPRYTLPSGGIAGKGKLKKIKSGVNLLHGILKARLLLQKIQPSAVIGFGGYPSIPPLLGSRLILFPRPKMIIHEGNAILGQANALLSHFTDAIATSYPSVARLPQKTSIQLTGMPVRSSIEELANTPYSPPLNHTSPITILIWGGSLGARIFTTVVPKALSLLSHELRSRLHIIQQVHEEHLSEVQDLYNKSNIHAQLSPFISNVADILKETHLIIGRAGGSSIAEITMAGRPAIMVPLPIAASDEQGRNAHALEKVEGGWMIRQQDFTPEKLASRLQKLLENPCALTKAANNAQSLQQKRAAEKLADLVETTLQN